jgi:hypothetical protein
MEKVENLEVRGRMLYRYVRGSTLYGLALEGKSDIDEGGVYMADMRDVLGLGLGYRGEVTDKKGDICYYELGKYLDLLRRGNPNILESLYIPQEFIMGKVDKTIKELITNRDMFLTKKCVGSFLGYANGQIKKARGLNKKVFKAVEEKGILDFCYTFSGQGSIPMREFLREGHLLEKYCGLVKVPNMRDTYGVYYDFHSHKNGMNYVIDDVMAYRGICGEQSVVLTQVPKGMPPLCYMYFNSDSWSVHCRELREYREWEEKRNPVRYGTTVASGKGYDAKNMMHCIRLLHMAKEVVNGEGFNVVRTWDRDMLLEIRSGKKEYEELLGYAEDLTAGIKAKWDTCDLPARADDNYIDELLIGARRNG